MITAGGLGASSCVKDVFPLAESSREFLVLFSAGVASDPVAGVQAC